MSGDSLDELRVLSDAATPGPWINQGFLLRGPDRGGIDIGELLGQMYGTPPSDGIEDAAFIVAAVNYVRAALR